MTAQILLTSALLCLITISPSRALGQSNDVTPWPPHRQPLGELIKELKNDTYTTATVGLIAGTHDRSTVPELKAAFLRATEPPKKEALASALIRLGEADPVYWSLLAERGEAIVQSNAPTPLAFDENGKLVRGVVSPQFTEWATAHQVPGVDLVSEQMYGVGGSLFLLIAPGDRRAVPIIQKGLHSPNILVQLECIRGLAFFQDRASIKAIIETIEGMPEDWRRGAAFALVYFDDPAAQTAAERFIKDPDTLDGLRKEAKLHGPKSLF